MKNTFLRKANVRKKRILQKRQSAAQTEITKNGDIKIQAKADKLLMPEFFSAKR
jgi:hypothetical protein